MELILTIMFWVIAFKAACRLFLFAVGGYPRQSEETAGAAAFALMEGVAWCVWIAWTIWR